MKLTTAKEIAGTLSFPSKMPGTAYGLPAAACRIGSKLAKIPGTVCSACYALKGSYARSSVGIAQRKRLAAIRHPLWVYAISNMLHKLHGGPIKVDLGAVGVRAQKRGGSRYQWNDPGWHRWHDSGDLQSVDHFGLICQVARMTPEIKHWLPTQELQDVLDYVDRFGADAIPDNLTIRVSSPKINDDGRRSWPQTSSVFAGTPPKNAHVCPAPKQGHRCGACRACWDRKVPHVVYELH